MFNYCFGQCGYDLYAEIHQNYYNQLIHGLFMPFLVYGVFIGLPALLNKYGNSAHLVLMSLYMSYFVYYLTFDPFGAILSAIVYYIPCCNATYKYEYVVYKGNRWSTVMTGIAYITFAVLVQEIFGHTLFEQANSDLSQLPTSLATAPLFGARSLFHVV